MAYQKVAGQKTYVKYDDFKKGDVIIEDGAYVGVEDNQFGGQNMLFNTPDGLKALTKSRLLGDMIDNGVFKTGAKYRITYGGKESTKDEKRSYSTFEVEEDADSLPAVAAAPQSASSGLAEDLQL